MPEALVLSAGGMFAAWEVGAWKALAPRFRPDIIVGASAGSWNGWLVAGGLSPEDVECEWLNPRLAGVMQRGLRRGAWFRAEPLAEQARELYNRCRPKLPYALTLAQVPRLRACLVRGEEIDWRHLAAACSIPMGFPPVKIDGQLYVDGGLLGALPLWAASEMGATRALALNCLTGWQFRMLRTVLRPKRPRPEMEVTLLEPSRPLGSLHDALFWKRANIERWIALGFEDASRAMTSVRM